MSRAGVRTPLGEHTVEQAVFVSWALQRWLFVAIIVCLGHMSAGVTSALQHSRRAAALARTLYPLQHLVEVLGRLERVVHSSYILSPWH